MVIIFLATKKDEELSYGGSDHVRRKYVHMLLRLLKRAYNEYLLCVRVVLRLLKN